MRGADPAGGIMNRIEAMKAERDGLDVQEDLVRFAREGWKTLGDDDKERLKWVGVFHRRPTPGHFMMRVRMPNGIVTAAQARLLGEITLEAGRASGRLQPGVRANAGPCKATVRYGLTTPARFGACRSRARGPTPAPRR